jgi:uncharacterized membrane protein
MDMKDLLLVGVGVVMVLLSLPMALRRVPPNHFYGLRVPATFADQWVWYEANDRLLLERRRQGSTSQHPSKE